MRSKIHIKSHPLHPILVAFPIAFFTGTLFADIFYLSTGITSFFRFATFSEGAGIFFSVFAAIPGIIDYIYTVPAHSSAKKRGAKHGLLNVSMLFLFIIAFIMRAVYSANEYIIFSFELAGVAILTVSGWLGGTLVYRNQIGVDHRYAHAGKWKEEYITDATDEIQLKGLEEMKPGQMKLLHINKKRIVIGRTDKGFSAFDDYCTHRGASLADGVLICSTVQCPWHGSQFDVCTGSVKAGPATTPIAIYHIEIRDGKYFLKISSSKL